MLLQSHDKVMYILNPRATNWDKHSKLSKDEALERGKESSCLKNRSPQVPTNFRWLIMTFPETSLQLRFQALQSTNLLHHATYDGGRLTNIRIKMTLPCMFDNRSTGIGQSLGAFATPAETSLRQDHSMSNRVNTRIAQTLFKRKVELSQSFLTIFSLDCSMKLLPSRSNTCICITFQQIMIKKKNCQW